MLLNSHEEPVSDGDYYFVYYNTDGLLHCIFALSIFMLSVHVASDAVQVVDISRGMRESGTMSAYIAR